MKLRLGTQIENEAWVRCLLVGTIAWIPEIFEVRGAYATDI